MHYLDSMLMGLRGIAMLAAFLSGMGAMMATVEGKPEAAKTCAVVFFIAAGMVVGLVTPIPGVRP